MDCPDCSKRLRWAQIRFGKTIRCPWCGSTLRAPQSYSQWLALSNLCLTGVIAFGFGARGLTFLAAVLIGFFPIAMVSSVIARRVLPPTLTFSDDYLTDIRKRQ